MIRRLPEEVVRKIAAGEVVAGAFSVVKELVENSLDAGANRVEVEIKNGGKSYIKVKDNGHGMTKEEVLLAIQPHTTSKISSVEDLYRIDTYGFRGEALSSIVKVSRVTILSKKAGYDGVEVVVEGGNVVSVKKVEAGTGTTIIVRDIFFNIPARRKFLKPAYIEGRMVTEQIQKFLLGKCDVHFVFVKDGEVLYNAPPSDLLTRIAMVMPDAKPREMIKVNYEKTPVKINGFISSPGIWKRNRTGQFFFVNKRPVLSSELSYFLELGYGESKEKGKYPYAVVMIELPPDMVDVNVHPQKIEVKFTDPEIVKDAIRRSVKIALSSKIERKLEINKTGKIQSYGVAKTRSVFKEPAVFETTKEFVSHLSPSEISENLPKFLLILKDRYILAEDEEGLLIIDYHAAHERVLYERLKEEFFDDGLRSGHLMFPINLPADPVSKDIVNRYREHLEKFGFEVELKEEEFEIKAVPVILPVDFVGEVFKEIIENLRLERFKELPEIIQKILSDLACKSAVRTGSRITEEDAKEVIREIYKYGVFSCPHGRPLVYRLNYKDIDRFFGRG